MLEHYYKDPRALVDLRRGPLGPSFDGFAGQLTRSGYAPSSGQTILGHCCIFNVFLIEQGIVRSREITPDLVESFIDTYFAHNRSRTRCFAEDQARRSLRHLCGYLTMTGAMKPFVVKSPKMPYGWMLDPYLRYLREERQLTDRTIQRTEARLHAFLKTLKAGVARDRMKDLKSDRIESHLKHHITESRENLRCLVWTLRGFLQFCARQGYTSEDLSLVLPSIPSYRLASIPKGIEDSAIQKILSGIRQDTPHGSRDYAILLLLTAYGIRATQVAHLVLDDINWPGSTIRIRALKGGKEVVLPLLEPVGEAILRFLQHRPESIHRQVFLSMRAPCYAAR